MRIIVVDDEPLVTQTLAIILRHAGYEVSTFVRAEEALSYMSHNDAHLLLTDMTMPGMNGIELAVKVAETWPGCQVIVLSGWTLDALPGPSAAANQPYAVVYKPIHPTHLLSLVADVLGSRRLPPRSAVTHSIQQTELHG